MEEAESIRIEGKQLDRLRKWIKETNQYKLGGFVSNLIKAHMDKIDKRKQSIKK